MATCSPSELLASGSCFQCLTKKELQIVIAQLLCEISGGGNSPKIYRALLTQSDTNAPTAKVLINTLGGIPVFTWEGDDGVFQVTLSGAFPVDKTFVTIGPGQSTSLGTIIEFTGWGVSQPDAFTFVTGGGVNGELFDTPIEILVYP